jgi:hypothetical protein
VSEEQVERPEPTAAYGAIGRYVVTFSHLVYAMRSCIENRLTGGPNGYHLVRLAIGEATASPLADSFFGMCSELARLEDDEDRKIAKTLKTNVSDEIKRRNDIAHGDWWPGIVEGSPKDRPALSPAARTQGQLHRERPAPDHQTGKAHFSGCRFDSLSGGATR